MTDVRTLEIRRELQQRAARSLARLDAEAARPVCIAFVGESNSGKTTAANSLLGDGLLPTAVITNTRFPTLVRFASEPVATAVTRSGGRHRLSEQGVLPDEPIALIEVGLPNTRLNGIEILDTPGGFPVEDLATLPGLSPVRVPVWCTVATQAWKESERRAWHDLPGRITRNGILAVTRLDRIPDVQAVERLLVRLDTEAGPRFALGVVAWHAASTEAPFPAPAAAWGALTDIVPSFAADLGARRLRTVERLKQRLNRLAALPDPLRFADGEGPARFGRERRPL